VNLDRRIASRKGVSAFKKINKKIFKNIWKKVERWRERYLVFNIRITSVTPKAEVGERGCNRVFIALCCYLKGSF
jgi:hypothetical protein